MKYRIVKDCFAGYEAQIKTWWWPFWRQKGFTNTFSTIEAARYFALNGCTLEKGGVPKKKTKRSNFI